MLGFDKLQEFVKQQQLIERLSESELNKKGGVAFDLRVAEIHECVGDGFLGVNERRTPELKLLGKYEDKQSTKIVLEPNRYYLVKTIEKINTPKNLAWIAIPRSTMYRSGLLLLAGLGDPGFQGEATFGLINLNNKPFTIELGARIANVVFYNIDGEAHCYDSAYQGGKIGAAETSKKP